MRAAEVAQAVFDLVAAQDDIAGQKGIPVEEPKSIDADRGPELLDRIGNGIVVSPLKPGLVDGALVEGVGPAQDAGGIEQLDIGSARGAHQRLNIGVGLAGVGEVVSEKELIVVANAMVEPSGELVVARGEGENSAVCFEQRPGRQV